MAEHFLTDPAIPSGPASGPANGSTNGPTSEPAGGPANGSTNGPTSEPAGGPAMSTCPVPLPPTFVGYLATTVDALVLLEACLRGHLNHVPRRPQDRERPELIQSGNIFIYEESASGIKRWTDGVNWSPSRILGNFLIYRELDKPFPPGEKKRALKKTRKPPSNGVAKPPSQSPPLSNVSTALAVGSNASEIAMNKEIERALVGSLVDSYSFKERGLVKKTISINYRGVLHHVVSYYNCDDILRNVLPVPTDLPSLIPRCIPRGELLTRQNFRVPLEQAVLYNISNGVTLDAGPPQVEAYHHQQQQQQQQHQQQQPHDGQIPLQEDVHDMQEDVGHYRPPPMSAMPPPMPFSEQPDFGWPQMEFMNGGFQHQAQHQVGGVQYSQDTNQQGLMPFDHTMTQDVHGHPGPSQMLYHVGGSA